MQNRFGLKDLFIILLIAGVGLMVMLNMVKTNREWDSLRDIRQKIGALETQLATLDRGSRQQSGALKDQFDALSAKVDALRGDIQSGVKVSGAPAALPASSASPSAASAPSKPGARDESWALPGAPVQWQPAWSFATDPRSQPGFQEGGTFTEAFEARPAKLIPFIQTDVYGRRIVDIVAETLGAYDPRTLKLRGVLAEAWQMDPAGMWMRAKIRDEARFSDGTPVTAEDLRWTFHDFVMNPQIEAQRTRSTVSDQIAEVRAVSERVVEVRFKQKLFSNLDAALTLFVLPKHFYETITPAQINKGTGLLMGSGPYKLRRLDIEDQWTPGQPIELVRNEQYWGPRPALDMIRFRDITDELARLTAYRNGEADMITPSAPQFVTLQTDAEFARANQMFKSITMRSGRSGLIWNCGERGSSKRLTPFHDKRVRQGMTMLLDREKMIRDIWKGIGQICKGFMNPNFEGSDSTIQPWPYDPTRGKALLKEAGWEDRDGNGVLENAKGEEFAFEFTFFTGGEIAQRVATFVKDSYEAAGIRVTLRGVDWSVGDPIRKQRDYDCMMMGWGANAPESDPKQIFHSESIKDQGDNFGQWRSKDADDAIDALRRETDFAKRMEHWKRFDRVMHDEQPYTWVRLQPEVRVVKPDVGNARFYAKGIEPWAFFKGAGSVMTSGN